ncbi:PAS domain S-box-containing protein [Bradyrhizobium lablabi]|uniref:histidine kinase n=3 Tax=Nitrobacteraceae TaxID=41294 RepID=A0ABY0P9D8_9BRAD|nr:PAS domain S-box-containing protein [Bradyrhizobium ottawaense]SEE15532.1 PAS domain S-box-containing protein [Bradyrhizobium lablabi]SHM11728.1 PAS domain S-box-containing protein [Bradyrhizobium lablabi]
MGARMRAKDWSTSPLGHPETWSQSVKTAVSICLNARVPIALWLGPELRLVYNDSYIPFLGETKHPAMLGAPGREAWGEIWAAIEPMHDEVAAGRATSVEDVQLFFTRRLPREEVYVSWGYSPILAADGVTIEGTFDACTETTAKVVGKRRLATLRDLGARSTEQRSAEVACRDAAEVLRADPLDIPFAAIYLLDEEGMSARRVAGTRLDNGSTVFPESHPVIHGSLVSEPWPLNRVAETSRSCQISDLPGTVGIFSAGPWPDPVETAVVLPLAAQTQPRPAGFLIAGVSPRRILDPDYRTFLDLVAGHIATSIADARAFEAERKRAEALAEIDRAKTNFFSNVSHEFRTPLTLMMNPIEEILAELPSRLASEHRSLLHVAHRNSLRLLRLVNTLLDFSRAEAGRIQANYEPIDLATLTADLASNFRSACERAGLALDVRCPSLGQPVYVDSEMWEKVVLNLISNAFKFTLDGWIEVAVHADGADAVLVVKDSGVGIPEAELPRVFERFHRVEGQRGRTHEGTGIGLALVQELVHLHRGEIRVESKAGHGTTFIVTVPFGRDHLPADRVQGSRRLASTAISADAFVEEALRWLPSAQASGISETIVDDLGSQTDMVPADRQRSRVLIVDDNADMREHLSRVLAKWWDVEAANDGLAALEAARQNTPDLVLADVMMPRLDGIGLLSALRSDPDLANIPVILLSARAGEEARIEGLSVGADDYLVKPFSARELVARVRSHLSMSRRLRESEARLEAAVDLVKLGRYAWNPQTNELQWDGTLKAMWGLPVGAPVDYDVWRAGVHPDDLARVEAAIQRCADPRGDGVYDIEYRVIGKTDGVERWIATRGQTGFKNGMPVAFYGVALDVTDRKRIEKSLERRVEARTRELEETNRQLRSQIEQREFAEAEVQQLQRIDAIGQTTSGVAHDFNNLLSIVLTNARLLSHSLREPGDQEGIELIRTAAERGVNLTAQLLAFSRKQRLEPQPVDLNSKIAGMREMLNATLGGTVQPRTVLAMDLWPALVDPNQIELVILNLAINARDAMPSGGILTLETFNAVIDSAPGWTEGLVPGQYVGLSVRDTGVGIPDNVLPRVFEPFFTTKEPGKGSGLGLAQAYGFAKQSGGGIGIETRIGEGTSVKVFLPRAEGVQDDHDQASIAKQDSPAKATATILVVDDDAVVLRTTLRLFDAFGFMTIPAASGREALQLIASGLKIDLVLADFAMPEMTGVELAKAIHATYPGLPVIVVSGYGNREELKDFGEARILQKPYTEGELMGKITEALNPIPTF